MNRREFLGMASVGGLVAAFAASRVLNRTTAETTPASFRVQMTDAQWRAKLNPETYQVLRKGATERPGTSPLLKEHRKGIFTCAGCDTPLFDASTKYDSKTGWPSFWQALPNATIRRPDFTIARPRTEILCSTCGGHLGHVFDDGPKPTGLRFCMNGDALIFKPATA